MGSSLARRQEESDWVALGASVRGIAHLLRNQPNQDAVAWSECAKPGGPVVVAVADGHGSLRHPRSGEGARFAVEIAIDLIGQWLREAPLGADPAALPYAIQSAWQQAVEDHLAIEPVEGGELRDGAAYFLYGTTLLVAGSYFGRTLCLQIGDGDILALRPDGSVLWPLPDSPDCFDNFTDSLCQDDAGDRFRVALIDDEVALLLLASDGYGNSYEDDETFEAIGPDYLALLNRVGPERVAAGLPGWLAEITRSGSGDDITLGLLWTPPG
ncbi:MAG: PP2C family serine/threonine-protein phosphatase [Aliidongia sp.]